LDAVLVPVVAKWTKVWVYDAGKLLNFNMRFRAFWFILTTNNNRSIQPTGTKLVTWHDLAHSMDLGVNNLHIKSHYLILERLGFEPATSQLRVYGEPGSVVAALSKG